MPGYTPQSLPMGAERKTTDQQKQNGQQKRAANPAQLAIQLGQYIRRERGMQGVRSYVASIREYLPASDYLALCKTMGVPANTGQQSAPGQQSGNRPINNSQANNQQPHQDAGGMANQMQMMQMLSQLMGAGGNNTGGNVPGGINPNIFSQLNGGTGGNNAGGINPMMLAQLLGGMNNTK